MTEAQIDSLQTTVVWLMFCLSTVLGAVMSKTNFCTMGAIADIRNFGDWTRMRMWVFAVAVAIAGTAVLAGTGLIDLSKSIYWGAKVLWLSGLIGGLMFGFGMVLASGCGSKTLIRIGGGSLKSLVVFIVMGLFAYMTLRGIFGVARVQLLDSVAFELGAVRDLASFAGTGQARMVAALVIAALLAGFCLKDAEFRKPESLLGGAVVGLSIVGAWYISGNTGYVAEHPATLEEAFLRTNTGRMESYSFVAPAAFSLELFMLWSDKTRVVTFGIAATAGMILGALLHSIASRNFRWEGFQNTEDTANHLVGAALMGIGGVTALGCTVGQGLSGLSTLSFGSFIAVAGIMAGGILGVKYQTWRVEKMI